MQTQYSYIFAVKTGRVKNASHCDGQSERRRKSRQRETQETVEYKKERLNKSENV